MKVDKFWVVYRLGGPAQTRHSSYESAHDEAERLALRDPRDTFVVLEAMEACSVAPPVSWVDCEQPLDSGPGGG